MIVILKVRVNAKSQSFVDKTRCKEGRSGEVGKGEVGSVPCDRIRRGRVGREEKVGESERSKGGEG